METSQTVATWLSLAVTVVGLGSLITQFGSFIDVADHFHSLRDSRHLGRWKFLQLHIPWYRIIKPPPTGPRITASLPFGICGRRTVWTSRLPLTKPTGKAAWAVILAVIHPTPTEIDSHQKSTTKTLVGSDIEKSGISVTVEGGITAAISGQGWDQLPVQPLIKHKATTCIIISRTTLIALFCVTNARPVFQYSGAAGFRAAYASYCGQWRVEWPLGDAAHVYFAAHDSHAFAKDVYPLKIERRVDKCLRMLAGVIDADACTLFKCAFPGRKRPGKWRLQYTVKGFGGAHSGRHLYNMIGGKVNEVDFLSMKPLPAEFEATKDMTVLHLPSTEGGERDVTLYVPAEEATILDKALDFLPWTSLSWSIHRGLRDILVMHAKDRMNQHRELLATTLRSAVKRYPERLDARGWDPAFVRGEMADMAAGAVMAGSGNSGDVVRIVTDIALILWDGDSAQLDCTVFWGSKDSEKQTSALTPMAVAALVKCFVLEWSNDLDYQLYHDLPLELYLG